MIFSNERIRVAIERHRVVALVAGIIASTIYLVLTFTNNVPTPGYNLKWMLFISWRTLNAWFWCVAVLGFASKHLNFNNRYLPYANSAVYPIYIVHLPIATVIAYSVLRWPGGTMLQFVIIVLTTLVLSLGLYEFVLRRTRVTRFMFGLKNTGTKRAATEKISHANAQGSKALPRS